MLKQETTVKMEATGTQICIEYTGPAGDVFSKATTSFCNCLDTLAQNDGHPWSRDVFFSAAINTLKYHLEKQGGAIVQGDCACKSESKPEEPPKHMSPAEYSAFMDAWMSQATQEEKAELLRLVVGDFQKGMGVL